MQVFQNAMTRVTRWMHRRIHLGVFLVLASVGYIVDGIGKTLSPSYSLNIAQFTFVGEVLLIFWLLWRGFKGFDKEAGQVR